MAVSVRMDPLLEKELALAAKRRGVTKSQFIVDAVERALGRKNPYELYLKVQAEERMGAYGPVSTQRSEVPYDTLKSRAALVRKLKAKHGGGGTR